jgi:hypothetical protein
LDFVYPELANGVKGPAKQSKVETTADAQGLFLRN